LFQTAVSTMREKIQEKEAGHDMRGATLGREMAF